MIVYNVPFSTVEELSKLDSTGIPFTLIHQYDRIPEWKYILETKYK